MVLHLYFPQDSMPLVYLTITIDYLLPSFIMNDLPNAHHRLILHNIILESFILKSTYLQTTL